MERAFCYHLNFLESCVLLPIVEFLPQIKHALASGRNLILQAEPGAGKSTAFPLSLLDVEWLQGKKILMLEPRRIAAKSIAHYLAQSLGERVGQRVGYQIKNERKISQSTVLEIVTEGILTRRLQGDPEISEIALIIFDEFHERSIHGDLSLMLALEIQQSIREDLKLVVMSATLDTQRVARYMDSAQVIECPGRAFPVTVQYRPVSKRPLVAQVMVALDIAFEGNAHVVGDPSIESKVSAGDVLVFLPGQADINRCVRQAKEKYAVDTSEEVGAAGAQAEILCLPLFGGLSLAQQEQALLPDPKGRRRIVFTTNIAETSVTIEGVTWVIDSGLEKTLIFDPSSAMTRLDTGYISKASAEQRKGRAGRTQAGVCIRLWNEQKQKTLREYQGEEIISADLSSLVLELCTWGSGDYEQINWLTRPPEAHYRSAQSLLLALGLIDAGHKATALGLKASGMGLPPRLAAMLLKADGEMEQHIACELAPLLSERDIFLANNGSDIVARLLALQLYQSNRQAALREYPLHRAGVEQLKTSVKSLKRTLKLGASVAGVSLVQMQQTVGKLLLHSYPDRLGKRRSNSEGRYHLANGRGVFLYEDDPLYASDWLVIADCDAQKKEGRIYSAAVIDFDLIIECLSEQFEDKELFDFDFKKQRIHARRVTQYRALEIKSALMTDLSPEKFQTCLRQAFQSGGSTEADNVPRVFALLNWTPACETWLARAHWLGEHLDTFPSLSKAILANTLEDWLLPYLGNINSIAGLKKLNVMDLLLATLSWDDQQALTKEAPVNYQTPSGKVVAIVYDAQQGPTISVQLQEMFGQITSPTIARGRVALRFELLSPARRPIQTTSDLAHFWQNSYFDVAKDMRGRYPKHRWPEQPLLEKPGKSIKRR